MTERAKSSPASLTILDLFFSLRGESTSTDTWDQHEQQVQEQNRREQNLAQVQEERNPSRKCMHRLFRMISLLTGICAFFMALGQVVGMTFENIDAVNYVFRGYVIVLCLLVIFVEAEWTALVKNSSILRYWITRGLIYSFVGVVGIQQNDHVTKRNSDQDDNDSVSLQFIRVVAWLMVGCGILYFGMGVLCLQIYYNRLRRDYDERCGRAVHIRDAMDHLTEAADGV